MINVCVKYGREYGTNSVLERAQRKSRTFSALANYTSRSVDLRKKSNLLAKSTRERLCRKALVQWDNKTISRHNARINFKVLKKRSEEALVRNYANKWKLETVHKRSKVRWEG